MTKKAESKDLAVKKDQALVNPEYTEMMLADSQEHSGFENMTSDDMSIPFLVILQALSPQVRGSTKIQGAEEGNFFNTVTNEIFKGDIMLIPCAYQKAFVEWVPRNQGGGFITQHFDSNIFSQTKRDPDTHADVLPNGNHIVTTAYHYCLLVKEGGAADRVVISFTSTQLKKSRRWNSQMINLKVEIGGKYITPPMYSHMYKVSSQPEDNDKGEWSGWVIGAPTMIKDPALYQDAKAFHQAVVGGLVKTQEPVDLSTESSGKRDTDESAASDHF